MKRVQILYVVFTAYRSISSPMAVLALIKIKHIIKQVLVMKYLRKQYINETCNYSFRIKLKTLCFYNEEIL